MSFLATPGFAFAKNWLFFYPSMIMFVTGIGAMYFFVPLFRKVSAPSGYEYLEKRFGTWARLYAAFGFLIFNGLRVGVVLYATSLALHVVLGVDILTITLVLGIATTLYTMAGGFEAVIWSEMLQVVLLFAGAAVLVPMALNLIDGGFMTVIDMGMAADKFSPGSLEWSWVEATLWVMIISNVFSTISEYSTRQDFIQRYRAAKSTNHARLAIFIGAATIIPIWGYFHFLGTSLWTYYEINPDPVVAQMLVDSTPEKIVPYFIVTQIPNGLRGLVMGAILMATLSTLAPMINACSVTFMDDFYKRLMVKNASDKHYLLCSRVSTIFLGVLMIVIAILFDQLRSNTLQEFNYILALVVSAGMMGLFFVGFFSRRVSGKAAGLALLLTISFMLLWLVVKEEKFTPAVPYLLVISLLVFLTAVLAYYKKRLGSKTVLSVTAYSTVLLTFALLVLKSAWWSENAVLVSEKAPNLLWTCVLTNSFFMIAALILGRLFPKASSDLSDVTWQGLQEKIKAQEAAGLLAKE